MRIVFICGSIDPGRDGVGDYTTRLAFELINHGHQAGIVSLNERQISDIYSGERSSDGTEVKVLRLPSSTAWKKRIKIAKDWIDAFAPEWLSLQYVPFSFHPKGLPFRLASQIGQLGPGRQWHIMFHELWLGLNLESSLKHYYWGWIQKRITASLAKDLSPSVVHTQCKIYKSNLSLIGVEANILPLFSNISVASNETLLLNQVKPDPKARMTFVLFGSIYEVQLLEEFAKEVFRYAKIKSIPLKLYLVGKSGKNTGFVVNMCRNIGIEVEAMGELKPNQVHKIMGQSNIGISTTPIALSEKSGAIATMKEHGLPIICISSRWTPRKIKSIDLPYGIFDYRPGNFCDFISVERPIASVATVYETCTQFISSCLQSYSKSHS